ncbi:Carbohydrate binding domain (family 25) [Halobacteroides halobius DSM 5150]|uniref:Carbohydrate binding domain (Family 25) n=1 Tax=Halobacteroides halobius (strain ATCC 35273 / DSM 5150 / MD-1) TaxID=748449 RepID=L0K8C2_HALHC|nr:carbohydrate-binding protein [Halobacteroides halobius]AGB40614.1 Carbohydrate binding domain (family 25) [Halobacteroides halobius DSM 5150]
MKKEVNIAPKPIHTGDIVTVSYNGKLAKNGAEKLYIHAGTSSSANWQNITDIEMQPGSNGYWTAQLEVQNGEQFNFCFKDSANNWDNNNHQDWSYDIY